VGSVFDFLEVKYYELLEMNFFFSPKIFLGVSKYRLFMRNIYGTLGDALKGQFGSISTKN
jgi:hypothetical protein